MLNSPTLINVLALALLLLTVPVPSLGQQPGKVYRIGYLGTSEAPTEQTAPQCPRQADPAWQSLQSLLEGLEAHGYIEGQNLIIECRWRGKREERAPALAAELVSLKPDLIVAVSTVNVRAAKQATTEIPILMMGVIDPVRRGLVASLAHPSGNVTGLADTVGMELEEKRLELLKEAVPKVSRVAVLHHSGGGPPEPTNLFLTKEEAAARALNVTLQLYAVRGPNEFAGAFSAMTKARAEALFVVPHPFWEHYEQQIVVLAAQSRLPAVYPTREFVDAGGLMTYDVNRPAFYRRLGWYADRILKGTKPGDLPVEQPTKFELVINLKTAKALGLTIPPTLLIQADEVIR